MPTDLSLHTIGATLLYAVMGMLLMLIFMAVFDKLFKLNLHKELVEDQNQAFGTLLGGVAIGIAIIIAASIV